MSKSLPRCPPIDKDVDPGAVLAFVEAIDADESTELHSLMVVRHRHVVAEGWWAPHTPERPRLLYSLTKSFSSTALGIAVGEGLVDLDDTVVSHFPEFADEITDPGSRSITLRHVVSMASGHNRDMKDEALQLDPHEPVRGFLMVPPDEAPGTVFAYSQPCTYTVGSVVQRAAGCTLSEYLRPRLFDPLGIGEVGWLTWPPGREQAFSGLFARTEDIAKLGILYLQKGRWGNTQLIPEHYVIQATSRQIDTPGETNPDWSQGYGFQFWMSRHGYRGDGGYGQFCVVLPEQDAVIAITGGTEAMQAVLDHLWVHLLPGFNASTLDNGAQSTLEARLRSLALPACLMQHSSPSSQDWYEQAFRVTPRAQRQPGSSWLTSVSLRRADESLEITLAESDNAITFPVGTKRWLTSTPHDVYGDPLPVAASGGWHDDDMLRVEVIFLETPHRLDITCLLPARIAETTWRQQPLDAGRLQTQHRPGS